MAVVKGDSNDAGTPAVTGTNTVGGSGVLGKASPGRGLGGTASPERGAPGRATAAAA